jgi:ribosome biogenesis GTPase A
MEEPEVVTGDNKNDLVTSAASEEWAKKLDSFNQQILAVLSSVDRKKVKDEKKLCGLA